MALPPSADPRPSLFDTPSDKADENEINGYRSVSPMAVLSLVLGVGSVLCFLALDWLFLPVGSAIAGLLAIRKIRKFPELATGEGYARAGIALSLACGLGAVTYTQVVLYQIRRETTAVSVQFAEAINSRKVNTAAWFFIAPQMRVGVRPEEVDANVEKLRKGNAQFMDTNEVITALIRAIEDPAARVEFEEIEVVGIHDYVARANARFRVTPGGTEALAYIRSANTTRGPRQYYIELLEYPRKQPRIPSVPPAARVQEVMKNRPRKAG